MRLAATRAAGDIADAAAMAAGKSKAIVFVNTGSGASSTAASPPGTPYDGHTISAVTAMSAANVNLIQAVAAANANTIVVINSDNPVATPWVGEREVGAGDVVRGPGRRHVDREDPARPGQPERAHGAHVAGEPDRHDLGLQRARGRALPGLDGRTAPGAAERERGLLRRRERRLADVPGRGRNDESEGIYAGYRYYDKLGIPVAFPFGHGLSYTSFGFSKLKVDRAKDGGLDVKFTLENTGGVAGAEAAQVYVGPPANGPAAVQFAVWALAQFTASSSRRASRPR